MRGTHVKREKFRFEGRSYTLFKRGAEEANWEIDFRVRGRRYHLSLETPKWNVALCRAKKRIELAKAEKWVGPQPTPAAAGEVTLEYCSVGDVLAAYRERGAVLIAAGEMSERTVSGAVSSLGIVLREALGVEQIEKESAAVFSAKLVRDYLNAISRRIAGELDDDEESEDERAQRMKRTANSYVQQARSVLVPRMVLHYRTVGLVLPSDEQIRGFLQEPLFARVGKREYNPPAADIIAATFGGLDSLRKVDRNAYLAVCLACGTGMRRGEVRDARWSWFRLTSEGPRVRSNVRTKNGQFIDLPVLDEWWKRIAEVKAERFAAGDVEDGYVLEGNATERGEDVFRRIGNWMRGLGWRTQKTFHEFRAYVGSMIAQDSRYGMDIASLFLRHHSVDFTRRFYLRYVKLNSIRLASFGAA